MVIRRISPLSCAKVSGILYAGIGLLIGALFSVISVVIGGMADQLETGHAGMPGMFGALFGVAAIVILPICYGILGFVGGAITAWLYNIVAGVAGGLEIEVS
jgi:hypothetical protein